MKILFFTFFFFLFFKLDAVNHGVKAFSSIDGLSQNSVTCLLQDSQGFMWFGTRDGLNRFDGYDFKSYHFDPDGNERLNSNLIRCIAEDKYKNIWVGASAGGLNRILYKNDSIISVAVPSKNNNLLAKKTINRIDIVDNLVLVFTKEMVFFLQITSSGYQPIKVDGAFFKNIGAFSIECFYRINPTNYLIGTSNGLKKLTLHRNGGFSATIRDIYKTVNVNDILPFRSGYLVCCVNRLFFLNSALEAEDLVCEKIQSLLKENEREVWAATNNGLLQLTFRNENSLKYDTKKYFNRKGSKNHLSNMNILCLYRDKRGSIWAGTDGGGVLQLFKKKHTFPSYPQNPDVAPGNFLKVNAFCEDSKGGLWMGTKNGLYYYPSSVQEYVNPLYLPGHEKGAPDEILSLFELIIDDEEAYIIAGTQYPLNPQVYNLKGEQCMDNKISSVLKRITHPINTIAKDESFLWLGTMEGGLYRYDLSSGEMIRFLEHNTQGLESNNIRSLCFDSASQLWVGTSLGLCKLAVDEKSKWKPHFEIYTNQEDNGLSLSYDYVLSLAYTSRGELWVGTMGGGVNRYNKEDGTFLRITGKDGLPNNNIKAIVEDENGNLWLSSNQGISCLNPVTLEVLNFGLSDGLQGKEFVDCSVIKRKSGELLFGGNNGFNAFYPDQIEIDRTVPRCEFTGMEIATPHGAEAKKIGRAGLLDNCCYDNPLKMNYNENSFWVQFSALNYSFPDKIKYKYRLDGFEKKWNYIDAKSRSAKYTNLNPGIYKLEVLATNSDGFWGEIPVTLALEISPPWHKTNIAIVFYALVLLGLILFFNYYSFIRNKIKNELKLERIEAEKEIEVNQAKFRFFTDISHELRTPLTVIKSYFDHIIPNWKSLSVDQIQDDFAIIDRNVNSLLGLVSQILDFRRLEQNKMTLVLKKADFSEFIQNQLPTFRALGISKNIEIQFHYEEKPVMVWFDAEKMVQIMNNLLSNAVKNSPQNGQVDICLEEREGGIQICVVDNGVGIPFDKQERIFERFYSKENESETRSVGTGIGLCLTKRLVELHHGRIELKSIPGNGACFSVWFPIKPEDAEPTSLDINLPSEVTEQNLTNYTYTPPPHFREKMVLVIEDNKDLCGFLVSRLSENFKVVWSGDGKEGLQICRDRMPDLVVSDVMMPGMNGFELCDAIKSDEKTSHISVLLLTAKTGEQSQLHGYSQGADAYIEKPFNMEVLLAQMGAVIKSRENVQARINENPFFKASDVVFTNRDENFLNKITGLIEEHMANPSFSVEQLSELCEIQRDALNAKLKALTGKTTIQYIRLIRLRRAAKLLCNQCNRVSDVTYDVGYSDLQHFREHFKKEFGLSPNEYKKKNSG